jgi:glycerol kinase
VVVVPEVTETPARGAASRAGGATGRWGGEAVAAMWRAAARYGPRIDEDRRRSLLAEWHRAVERSRDWASPGEGREPA